jgi:hypothetical protein
VVPGESTSNDKSAHDGEIGGCEHPTKTGTAKRAMRSFVSMAFAGLEEAFSDYE